jgi:hypothetical protein
MSVTPTIPNRGSAESDALTLALLNPQAAACVHTALTPGGGFVSLCASEVIVRPVLMDGIVDVDYSNRTLIVKRPEQAGGMQRLAWRTAHTALLQSQATGYRTGRTVWASGAGQADVVWTRLDRYFRDDIPPARVPIEIGLS